MRILFVFRYIWRIFSGRGRRTVWTVLALSAGVASLVSLRALTYVIQASLSEHIASLAGGQVILSWPLEGMPLSDLEPLHEMQRTGQVANLTYSSLAPVRVSNGAFTVSAFVRGVDAMTFPLHGRAVKEPDGQSLHQLLQGNQILVTTNLLDRLDVTIGDQVWLAQHSEPCTIVGLAELPFEVTGDEAIAGTVLIGFENLPQIAGRKSRIHQVWLDLEANTQLDTFIRLIRGIYTTVQVRTIEDVFRARKESYDVMGAFLSLSSFVSLLLGGVTVANTMEIEGRRRWREIGTLKALGAKNIQVILLVLVQTAMTGLLGALIGILLGEVAVTWLSKLAEAALDLSLSRVFPLAPVFEGLAMGVLVASIFGLAPALVTSSVQPQAILRLEQPSPSHTGRVWLITFVLIVLVFGLLSTALLGWPRGPAIALAAIIMYGILRRALYLTCGLLARLPTFRFIDLRLALRSIQRDRRRAAGILMALIAGIFAIGLAVMTFQMVRSSLFTQLKRIGFDLMIIIPDDHDPRDAVDSVQRIAGVTQATAVQNLSVRLLSINGRSAAPLMVASIKDDPEFDSLVQQGGAVFRLESPTDPNYRSAVILEGRDIGIGDAGKPYVVVLETVAAALGIKIGDQITLGSDDQQLDLKVIGVEERGMVVNSVFRTPANILDQFGGETSWQLYVRVTPEQERAVFRQLCAEYGAGVLNLTDLQKETQAILERLLRFAMVIGLLFLLAGVTAIVNGVALTALERTRELGILKAIGASRWRVLSIFLTENAVLGMIAGLTGSLLALVVAYMINSLLFQAPGAVDFLAVPLLVVLSIAVGAGATLLAAWQTANEVPLKALRHE